VPDQRLSSWANVFVFCRVIDEGCGFHAIRTLSPPTSGHSFHAHSDRQSERSDAGSHC
jgi:hypothetical protein